VDRARTPIRQLHPLIVVFLQQMRHRAGVRLQGKGSGDDLPLEERQKLLTRQPRVLAQEIGGLGQYGLARQHRHRRLRPLFLGPRARSNDLNRVSRQPNILLLKPGLEAGFEPYEELPVLSRVFHVNKHSGQAIPVELAFMVPQTLDCLGLARDSAESLL
jgi:hypothetical protein